MDERGSERRPGPSGPTIVVTGATSGIGLQASLALLKGGATVGVVCRDADKAALTRERLMRSSGGREPEVFVCDLSSQGQVRALGEELTRRHTALHALLHVAALVCGRRTVTEDGLEMQLAVNHLAPFLLTRLLQGPLQAGRARVVTVTSRAHARARLELDDLGLERGYTAFRAYDRSKLANVLFTVELARRWAALGVTANCVQPGLVRTGIGDKHTGPIGRAAWWGMTRLAPGPERAGRELARLATDPDLAGVTGRYFSRGRPARSSRASRDPELARRLWEESERLTGL